MKNYFKRTWKNKIFALILLLCGYIPMYVEKDATAFVFMLIFAVPLFFASKDYTK